MDARCLRNRLPGNASYSEEAFPSTVCRSYTVAARHPSVLRQPLLLSVGDDPVATILTLWVHGSFSLQQQARSRAHGLKKMTKGGLEVLTVSRSKSRLCLLGPLPL